MEIDKPWQHGFAFQINLDGFPRKIVDRAGFVPGVNNFPSRTITASTYSG
jgi:hypothetical protein